MTTKFTLEDLTAYLYNEVSTSRRLNIEDALRADPVLADTLADMRQGKRALPRVRFDAPDRTLRSVLRYSRETTIGHLA